MLRDLASFVPASPPLGTLPCANTAAERAASVCDKPGLKSCSACRLVSYCSKECQTNHWKRHKTDCNSIIRSARWKPSWVLEQRRPIFLANGDEPCLNPTLEEFNGGLSLWGNMPAVDLVNLEGNENDSTRDLSLAFVASGDLRHVLKTVNSLPSNYSGKVDILINDWNPWLTTRNILLLLIIGLVPDESIAADTALHFWYSAFLPGQCQLQASFLFPPFAEHIESGQSPYPLGNQSTLTTAVDPEMVGHLLLYFLLPSSLSFDDAQAEYSRIRNAPSRRDYRDRMYSNLRPSHRVAFQKYRRSGIILPFGATSAHFNFANPSLFSASGKWLQRDSSDPLEGWDSDEVLKVGKTYGAQPEDIYGCLYFFLSDQLRMFARRVREFAISFKVTSVEATLLASSIRGGLMSKARIPPSVRFDRIEVSNILDHTYVGLRGVLTSWAPLLSSGKDATIVGYFMNWTMVCRDGSLLDAGEDAMRKIFKKMCEISQPKFDGASIADIQSAMIKLMDDSDALYENSKPFTRFLEKQGLSDVLRKTKLILREQHKIVPHRLGAPLQGSAKALPEFKNDDTRYYHTKLKNSTWVERYVEFSRE